MATEQPANQYVGKPDDSFQKDLNPNPDAGMNDGPSTEALDRFSQTAADIEALHDRLSGFSSEELTRIPILKTGTRLQQGGTYINLQDPKREEFTGMADMSVTEKDYIVPKTEVPYPLWNRLIGEPRS
ncbi:MAG: hypothetical protein ACFB5Z_17345 [Elainellaceae cyanobacterium]